MGEGTQAVEFGIPDIILEKKKVNVILAIESGDAELPPNIDGSIQNPRR